MSQVNLIKSLLEQVRDAQPAESQFALYRTQRPAELTKPTVVYMVLGGTTVDTLFDLHNVQLLFGIAFYGKDQDQLDKLSDAARTALIDDLAIGEMTAPVDGYDPAGKYYTRGWTIQVINA